MGDTLVNSKQAGLFSAAPMAITGSRAARAGRTATDNISSIIDKYKPGLSAAKERMTQSTSSKPYAGFRSNYLNNR